MDQNKLQLSFLLAMLTQVQGRASQEMARLPHTSSSGTGPSQELLRGSGTRRPVSLAPAHQMPEHPTIVISQKKKVYYIFRGSARPFIQLLSKHL